MCMYSHSLLVSRMKDSCDSMEKKLVNLLIGYMLLSTLQKQNSFIKGEGL